jgi:predicted kinase
MIAYILVGLPASGKSTWAHEHQARSPNTVIVNNDTIRNSIYEQLGHRQWSGEIESQVRMHREDQIRAAAAQQRDLIVDNTHLNHKTLANIKKFCTQLGYKIQIVDFGHVSVDECVARDATRVGHAQVGEQVIRDMHKKFLARAAEGTLPRWQKNNFLPTGVIVDLDGTLAEMTERGPYDEHRVYEDLPREHVLYTVRALQRQGVKLLIMSGRSENCRAETERWLQDKCGFRRGGAAQLEGYELWMRAADDRRRDSAVKRDLYDAHVRDRYSVMAVFDDRQQVVEECWNALGLPVFRCGVVGRDNF